MNNLEENEHLASPEEVEEKVQEEVEVPGEEPVTEEEVMDPDEAAADNTVDNEEHEASTEEPAGDNDE